MKLLEPGQGIVFLFEKGRGTLRFNKHFIKMGQ